MYTTWFHFLFQLIRQRARKRRAAEEAEMERANAAALAEGGAAANEEAMEEEEYEEEEEYTSSSSEDEMGAPKLKPVFVRRQERITLQAKQRADQIAAEAAAEAKRLADERRRDTLKVHFSCPFFSNVVVSLFMYLRSGGSVIVFSVLADLY